MKLHRPRSKLGFGTREFPWALGWFIALTAVGAPGAAFADPEPTEDAPQLDPRLLDPEAEELAPAPGASEEEPDPGVPPPWLVEFAAAGQINNIFGAGIVGLRYRETYGRDASNPLWNNLYWQVGARAVSSIYTNQIALMAEWVPIAIFKVNIAYKATFIPGFSSSLGTGLTFDDKAAAFGDPVFQARKGENVDAFVHQVQLTPTLQLKVGPVMAVNQFSVTANMADGTGEFLYDNLTDSLMRRGALDAFLENQTWLLLDAWHGPWVDKLYLGATYQYNQAVRAQVLRHRVGGMLLYSPARWAGSLFEPTLVVFSGVNVVDRNRGGTPYLLVLLRSGVPL